MPIVEPRTPFALRRIGEHMKQMIPTLQLPHNYKLKRKPKYLQRMHCRKPSSTRTRTTLSPPQSSLTPPPSPPSPLIVPTTKLPAILPPSIKHSLSDDQLWKMSQFTLKIHPCDNTPEFAKAFEALNSGDRCHSSCTSTQLACDGNQVEAIGVPDDGNLCAMNASQLSHSNESLESIDCNTNENHPNDADVCISNYIQPAEIDGTDQADTDDSIEIPSPPIEPIGLADNLDSVGPLSQTHERLDELQLNEQIRQRDEIINDLKAVIARHIAANADIRTKNEQLNKQLAECQRLQQQHRSEMQEAIEQTKNKKWCVNCKQEAKITEYKLPVCSEDCLLLVW